MSYKTKKNISNIKYTLDSKKISEKKLITKSKYIFEKYGFCVIDNIIPGNKIKLLESEVLQAQKKINLNISKIKEILKNKKIGEKKLMASKNILLRYPSKKNQPSKPPNDIIFMPKFSKYLAHTKIQIVAKNILENRMNISQLHPKLFFPTKKGENKKIKIGQDMFRQPRIFSGNENIRDWHADWPHDPIAYGGSSNMENIGYFHTRFQDLTLGIVMIHHLSSVNKVSGSTCIVPGSHKDKRNPRSPGDNINVTAKISGEMKISAKPGSVLLMNPKVWHTQSLYNYSNNTRVSVISRWYPWWLSVDGIGFSRFNVVNRPLSYKEYLKLPQTLKPYMKHLCSEVNNFMDTKSLANSKLASMKVKRDHNFLKKNYRKLNLINKKINVKY